MAYIYHQLQKLKFIHHRESGNNKICNSINILRLNTILRLYVALSEASMRWLQPLHARGRAWVR